MTVKTYTDDKAQQAVAQEVAEQFEAEFRAMCEKYKVEFSVRETTSGYETYAEGIDVDFDGIYEDGEVIRPYFTVSFGRAM